MIINSFSDVLFILNNCLRKSFVIINLYRYCYSTKSSLANALQLVKYKQNKYMF